MPLTSLELTIDQSCEGWLPRAGLEAEALLDAHGWPQMAAALRAEFARRSELAALSHYLRLRVLSGDASPLAPKTATPVGLYGSLDGRRLSEGRVPLAPCVDALWKDQPGGTNWNVAAGEVLIGQVRDAGTPWHSIHSMRRQPDLSWERGGELHSLSPFTHVCCDGAHLALLRPDGAIGRCRMATANGARVAWERDLFAGHGISKLSTALVLAEHVVVACNAGMGLVVALALEDGRELWRQGVTTDFDGPVVRVFGQFLCVLSGRDLQVFDMRSGEKLWVREGGAKGVAFCWGAAGHLYLLHNDGGTIRYRLEDGTRLEISFSLSRPGFGHQAPTALAASDDTLVLVQNWRLWAVGLEDGYPIRWFKELEPVFDCDDNLSVVGSTVLRSRRDTLSAHDLHSGAILWEDVKLPIGVVRCWGHPQGVLVSGVWGGLCFVREAGEQGEDGRP